MSCAACHMLLFLRAGHLGHLKNRSNFPLSPRRVGWAPERHPCCDPFCPRGTFCPYAGKMLFVSSALLSLGFWLVSLSRSLSWVTAVAKAFEPQEENHRQRLSCLPLFSVTVLTPSPFPFQKLLWASCHAGDTPMINFDFHQFAKGGKLEKLENLLRPAES